MAKQQDEKTKFSDASEALRLLAGTMKLERIVCVDDFYAALTQEDFNTFYGLYMEAAAQPNVSNLSPELDDLPPDLDEEDLKEQLRSSWESFSAEVQARTLYELRERREAMPKQPRPPSQLESDLVSFSVLQRLCHGIVEYIPLSPAQWEEKKGSLLSESSNIVTLFLFDQNLGEESGREDGGVHLMIEAQRAESAFLGLFSQKFDPGGERKRWGELQGYTGIDQFRCVPISKRTLLKEQIEFVRRIKYTAMIHPCHGLCDRIATVIGEAQGDALREIRQLSPYDFDHIVFHKSCDEGTWEVDAIFRLFSLFQRSTVHKRVRETPSIDEALQRVRELSEIPSGSPVAKLETWHLQQLDLYDEGDFINSLHMPIECGDIFEETGTEGGQKYILLAQPCDLMVREQPQGAGMKSGERRAGMTYGTLVPLTQNKVEGGELPYFEGGLSYYAKFPAAISIPLDVIDTCVFQRNGIAEIALGTPAPANLLPVWQKRYLILQESLLEKLAIRRMFGAIASEDAREAALLLLGSTVGGGLRSVIDVDSQVVRYNLKRVRRLHAVRASALLAQLAYYMARPAFETDWGK